MRKKIVLIALAIVMIVAFSACNDDEAELIRKLYNELENKTEECTELLANNQKLTKQMNETKDEKNLLEYERNAFLEENLNLRYELGLANEQIENFRATMEANFNNYMQYRNNTDKVYKKLIELRSIPYFDESIKESHKQAMFDYMFEPENGVIFLRDGDDYFTQFVNMPLHIKEATPVGPNTYRYFTEVLLDYANIEYPSQFLIPEENETHIYDVTYFEVLDTEEGPVVGYFWDETRGN